MTRKRALDAEQIRRDADLVSGTQWFKMAGRAPFHAQAPDWVHTGKGLCGADISRPALSVVSPMPGQQKLCEKCLELIRKQRGSGPLPGGVKGWNPLREDRERKFSMTYGVIPPFEQFEHDVHTRIDPESRDGTQVYWPPGTLYPMELVGSHEVELAENYGELEAFETERRRTGRNSRAIGFRGDEKQIYGFIAYLTGEWNDGDEEAGDLASSIMGTLGYEWI